VPANVLGFTECACGWGGQGGPIEWGHGIGLSLRRLDRKLANIQARKDLKRVLATSNKVASLGMGYTAALFLASTAVYLLLNAALAALIYFGYGFTTEQARVGLGACAAGACIVAYMLFSRRMRPKGIEAPVAQYPRLASALSEVSQRVGAPLPHRILLTPGSEAFV
jgi:hypothetical protein